MTQQDDRSSVASNADTDSLTADAAASAMAARGPSMPDTGVNPKQGARPADSAAAQREQDFERVQTGWTVFSSDGEQLGGVREVGDGWFSLGYGREQEHPMYVPVGYIETVANSRVVLNQPAGLLMDMKLDSPPLAEETAREGLGGRRDAPRAGEPGYIAAAENAAGEPVGLRTQEQMSPSSNPPRPREALPAVADPSLPPSAQVAVESDAAAGQRRSTSPPRLSASSAADAPDVPWSDSYQQTVEPRHTLLSNAWPAGRAAAAADVPGGMNARQALNPQGVVPAGGAATLPAVERRGDARYAVEQTVSSATVAQAVHRGQPAPAQPPSTHMAPAPGEGTGAPSQEVNAEDDFYRHSDERTHLGALISGGSYDPDDGPTHQAGVSQNSEHTPNRTQFSDQGTPGDGRERNITDTNLIKNQHPDGDPFGSQSATIGRPLRPGEPSAANRSIEDRGGAADTPPPGLRRIGAPPRA